MYIKNIKDFEPIEVKCNCGTTFMLNTPLDLIKVQELDHYEEKGLFSAPVYKNSFITACPICGRQHKIAEPKIPEGLKKLIPFKPLPALLD